MAPHRVFALPRQQSLLLPAVINPFVQDTKLSRATVIKVSMVSLHSNDSDFEESSSRVGVKSLYRCVIRASNRLRERSDNRLVMPCYVEHKQ